MYVLADEIFIPDKALKKIFQDPEKTAKAAKLTYVNDREAGITRLKKGKKFVYLFKKRKIKDAGKLQRIQKLVIPPAWKKVWICRLENGHLQATGIDAKKRKQYKYHPLWNLLRNHTKFYRLYDLGKSIPSIRQQLEKDLSLKGLPLNKVLAAVVSLMERTSIRVGNTFYEKLYGSFGLTTLKDQHVTIKGSSIQFMFKGKKGISHRINIKSKRLADIVKKCRDIPGKELFQYIDEQGNRHCIDSGMVNDYIKTISGKDFTAKDLRTWTGTVQALSAFRDLGCPETIAETKKNIVAALDCVARLLGNTRTVCKKYYVHPVLIDLYEGRRLHKYLEELKKTDITEKNSLACEEKILMKILEKESLRV
jgi:DNA topoisomerase-1